MSSLFLTSASQSVLVVFEFLIEYFHGSLSQEIPIALFIPG